MDRAQQRQMAVLLNFLFLGALFMTASFYAGLFTDLGDDDGSMAGAVTMAVGMVSSVAFLALGLGFLIGGKYQKIPLLQKLTPFMAIPILFTASIKESYLSTVGVVSNSFIGMFGIGLCLLLALPHIVALLSLRREGEK